jgi:hypothetical protein
MPKRHRLYAVSAAAWRLQRSLPVLHGVQPADRQLHCTVVNAPRLCLGAAWGAGYYSRW